MRTAYRRYLEKKETIPSGSGGNIYKEYQYLQWLNVYIENHETSTNLPCDEQLDDWIIKDQQILVSNKKDSILDQIPSTSQYDDAFNGYYVFEFVETEVIARERSVKSFLNSLAKFTRKHLVNLFKKRLWHRCFPVKFANFLRTVIFIEHLQWLLLFKLIGRNLQETKILIKNR